MCRGRGRDGKGRNGELLTWPGWEGVRGNTVGRKGKGRETFGEEGGKGNTVGRGGR